MKTNNQTKEQALAAFAEELAKLTRKHGIAISVTGGVITGAPEDFEGIEYFTGNDGDLLPRIGEHWL
ncbi:MAG: hypothetical protein HQL82_15745 [Magnetococcales bacterium]|nr:hypothetical protein [Magnetococcales bacterium]